MQKYVLNDGHPAIDRCAGKTRVTSDGLSGIHGSPKYLRHT